MNDDSLPNNTQGGNNTNAMSSHHGLIAQGAESLETSSEIWTVPLYLPSEGYDTQGGGDSVLYAEVGSSQAPEPRAIVYLNSIFSETDSWEKQFYELIDPPSVV